MLEMLLSPNHPSIHPVNLYTCMYTLTSQSNFNAHFPDEHVLGGFHLDYLPTHVGRELLRIIATGRCHSFTQPKVPKASENVNPGERNDP